MTSQTGRDSKDAMVVGYFAEGSDAYRAIHELIDEGFKAAEIGAAFRTPRAGAGRQEAAVGELSGVGELTERTPAVYSSVGGPASGDEGGDPGGALYWIGKLVSRGANEPRADSWLGNSSEPETRSSGDATPRSSQPGLGNIHRRKRER